MYKLNWEEKYSVDEVLRFYLPEIRKMLMNPGVLFDKSFNGKNGCKLNNNLYSFIDYTKIDSVYFEINYYGQFMFSIKFNRHTFNNCIEFNIVNDYKVIYSGIIYDNNKITVSFNENSIFNKNEIDFIFPKILIKILKKHNIRQVELDKLNELKRQEFLKQEEIKNNRYKNIKDHLIKNLGN